MTSDHDLDAAGDAAEEFNAPALGDLPGRELASMLAARLCHDFISPASAIMSGLELLDDPEAQDMRDDAMTLISGSARKLIDQLQFARVAFGGGGAERFGRDELEALAQSVFSHHRGALDWSMTPNELPRASARALVNLCAIAAAALPMGGEARLEAVGRILEHHLDVALFEGGIRITADCRGPRARLRPELAAGLRGEGPGGGLAGHWIQAAWTQALVAGAGGALTIESESDRVLMTTWLPA